MYKMNDIRAEVMRFDAQDVVATSGYRAPNDQSCYFVSGKVAKAWAKAYGDCSNATGVSLRNADSSYSNVTGLNDSLYYEFVYERASAPNAGYILGITGYDFAGYSPAELEEEYWAYQTGNNIWGDDSDETVNSDFLTWLNDLAFYDK